MIVKTDLSIGAGLGSSASFCVSIVAALYQYYVRRTKVTWKKEFDKDELDLISKWGYLGEKIFHGTPSGLDNTICTHGSMVAFRKGGFYDQVKHPKVLRVLLINTNVARSTKVLVAKATATKERHPDVIGNVLEGMEGITKTAIGYLTRLNELEGAGDIEEVEGIYTQLGVRP